MEKRRLQNGALQDEFRRGGKRKDGKAKKGQKKGLTGGKERGILTERSKNGARGCRKKVSGSNKKRLTSELGYGILTNATLKRAAEIVPCKLNNVSERNTR